MKHGKPIIGLMGGIASGKSTVAACFAELGCAVIDADAIAHQLLDTPAVREQIRGIFGQEVFRPDGGIDRGGLAERVFENADSVNAINKIIHPPVLARCQELIDEFSRCQQTVAIVLDLPLLAETGWAKQCDVLVFVDCDPIIRAQRVAKKGIFTENSLKKRENFQISLDTKAKTVHYTVENNSDLSVLAEQVNRIFTRILGKV